MRPTRINEALSDFTLKLISMYLKFPEGQPITALDFNVRSPKVLTKLTEKHQGEKYLYAVTQNTYTADYLRNSDAFHKVSEASYKAEGRMSEDAFSMVIVDANVSPRLQEELFSSVDSFTEPDFEKRERDRLAEAEKLKDFIDFGDEGLTEEQIAERDEEAEKKLEKAIKDARIAYRRALREQEKRLSFERDDSFLLARASKRLMPGGILVMFTPKEMIDQTITIKLCNQYEDIKILRLDDDEYQTYRKCVIIAKKRKKKSDGDRSAGILLAETKLTPYKEIPTVEPQITPAYHVPSQDVEAVQSFRIGPLTPGEVLSMSKRSPLINNYIENFSQVLTVDQPVSPTPLHKGHIMLCLTSGFLNGYIGTGPDQHLVKGTALKMSREFTETDDDGTETTKEREYYHITVKHLNREGKFHSLM
jgi:hypothetical protein